MPRIIYDEREPFDPQASGYSRKPRPHGRLFMKYELRIEATPRDDADVDRLVEQLEDLDIEESLAAVSRRIEDAIPDVRVEVVS